MIRVSSTDGQTLVEVPGIFRCPVPDGDWLLLDLALTAAQGHASKARRRAYVKGYDIDNQRSKP